ncbi:MAG: hypothetical protein AMK69_02000 [Nitrospira bacterium SG8_3]|nr:MAG: hypothetical protein AMK69_02000 [Nitrospira bacterium SG8_3]
MAWIDLSEKSISVEALNEEMARERPGQHGMAGKELSKGSGNGENLDHATAREVLWRRESYLPVKTTRPCYPFSGSSF